MFLKAGFLFFILMFCVFVIRAQKPYWTEIQAFKVEDSLHMPQKNAILFIGSSSIRMWKNLQEMFPGYPVINRGFGGSTLPEVDLYVEDIVFPYQPKQVIVYAGENDIASGTVDSKTTAERFKTLFTHIRNKLPGIPIVFISMKPSPSREQYLPAIKEANQLINNYLWQQKNAGFVDIYTKMLDDKGNPRRDLFLEDMLHMNQKGYQIWQEALIPYLLKN